MKAMISGQADLVVVMGDAPIAHPISGGQVIRDPYTIARRFDGCDDMEVIEVETLAQARTRALELRELDRAKVRRILDESVGDAPVPAQAPDSDKKFGPVPRVANPIGRAEPRSTVESESDGKEVFVDAAVIAEAFAFRTLPGITIEGYLRHPLPQKKKSKKTITSGEIGFRGYRRPSSQGASHGALQIAGSAAIAPAFEPVLAADSPELQVAILTKQINQIVEKRGRVAGRFGRRGLLRLVSQRRSILNYLRSMDEDRYLSLIQELGIRR